jgi:hypothetical protein
LVAPFDNVQYFVCDNNTFGCDLDIVVALGINYSQYYSDQKAGTTRKPPRSPLPNKSGAKAAAAHPWVEEDLSSNKTNLVKQFAGYRNRPKDWFEQCWASSKSLKLPNEFHLVETNFCPWITIDEWSSPFHSEPLRADILVNPPNPQRRLVSLLFSGISKISSRK